LYDISERKKAEDALTKERNFVSAILDTAGALVVVLDTQGRIIRFNRGCEQITGYSFDEVQNKFFWNIFLIPEEVARIKKVFDKLKSGHFPSKAENYWITKQRKLRLITWSNTALLDEKGSVEYIISTGIDITEQREFQEALQKSEQKYRELVESANSIILRWNRHGNITFFNEFAQKFFGYSENEILGKNLIGTIVPEEDSSGQDLRKMIKDTVRNPENFINIENENVKRNGERVWISWTNKAISDESGSIREILSVGIDETEEKKATEAIETRLRYEEGLAACSHALMSDNKTKDVLTEALNHLLDASSACRVYIFENFKDENKSLCFRITHEACSSICSPRNLDNPDFLYSSYKNGFIRWQKILSQGKPIWGFVESFPESEQTFLEPQGILSILVIPLWIEGKWYGFIGFDDVEARREWNEDDIRLLQTSAEMVSLYIERKKVESALRDSEERFRGFVEEANDIIYELTPEGIFSYVSPNWTEILGHDVSEIQGKSFLPFVHPDDLEACMEFFRKVIKVGEKQSGIEYRVKHKNKKWRWHHSSASPLKDKDGNVLSYIGIAHDITELKKVMNDLKKSNKNLKETQAQLVQSEKMASLGSLVAGIAHEINTPIGAVSSMHDTLFRSMDKLRTIIELKCPEEFEQLVELKSAVKIIDASNKVIRSGTERVINIVRRLKSFARLDEAELKKADIHEGLEDTLTLVHHEIKHNITITKDYSDIPPIACFPGQLNQVFLNLLINSKQAIQNKGIINITTFTSNNKVHIIFKDNGIGIPRENLKKIFDPGFTTKGRGVGAGLGLSICYQIIQDHRGEIKVKSTPGKGTVFSVILPNNLEKILNISL
ncbi:PAS domain S-box protein, partial [Acidobacteriota bacterium]